MFEFSDHERAYLAEMRGLEVDTSGRERLVGLSEEETAFYMEHTRDELRSPRHRSDTERYLALHDKHELARLAVLSAEVQMRNEGPSVH